MPQHCQPMRTRQARRTRADHGNSLARQCRTGERMHARGHQLVRGIPLQTPDFDRLAFGHFPHTDLFAEVFGRADPCAHAAKDIHIKDCLGRRLWCAGADLADKQRDVDVRGAGCHAGRIMAEIASVRRNRRLVRLQWGVQV